MSGTCTLPRQPPLSRAGAGANLSATHRIELQRTTTARPGGDMSETINQSTGQERCAHARCLCTVPPGLRFCGEYCERAVREGETAVEGSRCGCAHAPCDEGGG
jgi:hypothetical protein